MRVWSEVLAGIQIVVATTVALGAPVFLILGSQRLAISEEQYAAASAFVGIAFGALLSVFVQAYFSWQQERARRVGVAYSIFFKVLRYASDAEQVCRHVERHRPPEGQAVGWRTVQPLLLPTIPSAEFTAEELTLFAIGGQAQFADALVDFASVHNHLVNLSENYRVRQEALARGRLQNRVAGRPDNDLEVDEDIVVQLAQRLLVLARDAQPEVEDLAHGIGDRLSRLLDNDPRFRGRLGRRE